MNDEVQIPEYIIKDIYSALMRIPENINLFSLYKEFYKSKYEQKEYFLKEYKLHEDLVEMEEQYSSDIFRFRINNEYEWIKIYPNEIGEIKYRYYIAPNPDNIHELVENLASAFLENNAPVKFKYQLEKKMADCDRIIIYCDKENKEQVEKALRYLYQNNEKLFDGSERALPWIYESSVPNIYIAPETPGFSYGLKFADTLIKIKQSINNLPINTTYEIVRQIIVSTLKNNGLLFKTEDIYNYEHDGNKKK